jgi:hypothetical protein
MVQRECERLKFEAVQYATLAWVSWGAAIASCSDPSHIPPVEAEDHYDAATNKLLAAIKRQAALGKRTMLSASARPCGFGEPFNFTSL